MPEETIPEVKKKTVSEAVADQIKVLSPRVEAKVIDIMVERELDKRVTSIVSGFDKLKQLKQEFYKFKPDVISYNLDGTVKDESWTKAKLEERTKAHEQIEKLEKALADAVDKGDMKKLNEFK